MQFPFKALISPFVKRQSNQMRVTFFRFFKVSELKISALAHFDHLSVLIKISNWLQKLGCPL